MKFLLRSGVISVGAMLIPLQAMAQDNPNTETPPGTSGEAPEVLNGWEKILKTSFSASMSENQEVVGQVNGISTSLGLNLGGEINYKKSVHEWRNSSDIVAGFTRTPQFPEYLKSEDSLSLDSTYLYYPPGLTWVGPFAKFTASTTIFQGRNTETEDNIFIIETETSPEIVINDSIKLTDPFKPLRFKESLGAFFHPYTTKVAFLELRAGFAMHQLFAKDQLIVEDDENTTQIEVNRIESYKKAGLETALEFRGNTPTRHISYKFSADMLIPYIESNEKDGDDRTAFEKRIVELELKLSFHLARWASLDYLAQSLRDPDTTDKAQNYHSLMFSFNHTFTDP